MTLDVKALQFALIQHLQSFIKLSISTKHVLHHSIACNNEVQPKGSISSSSPSSGSLISDDFNVTELVATQHQRCKRAAKSNGYCYDIFTNSIVRYNLKTLILLLENRRNFKIFW